MSDWSPVKRGEVKIVGFDSGCTGFNETMWMNYIYDPSNTFYRLAVNDKGELIVERRHAKISKFDPTTIRNFE